MRFSIPFLIFFIWSANICAQNINEQQAQELAGHFMSNISGSSIEMQPYSGSIKSYNRFYVFTDANNSSFIVLSKSKQAFPVIAWSDESGFSDPMPVSVKAYFDWIDDQLHYIDTTPAIYNQSIVDAWKSLEDNGYLPQTGKDVTPLLSTKWNQGCYYNEDCPVESSGPCGRCYAGCVATAMAQVMKYHSYPSTGVGTHMYGTGLYPNLTADFGATTYIWDSMPNSLSASNSEIAQLLYQLGVSVNMDYSPTGSGASTITSRDAFVDYFRYSDYCFHAEKNNFTETDWIYMIENELNSRRPLLYRGSGSGGHAFVLDGIQNSNLFHFNWGWSGAYDGYFTLSNLRPGGNDFTSDQAAVFALEPQETDMVYCNEYNTFTALTDTISDGSGQYRYGNNTGCKWTISPPGAGLIYINFIDLATEKDADVISVYNGTSTSDPLVATVSGFDIPGQILVWGSSAYVTFYSDGMMRADGFTFEYTSCQVSIEEAWNQNMIIVFPNPASDFINIDIDNKIISIVENIDFMNSQGEIIASETNPETNTVFRIGNLPAGVYFIRFSNGNEVIVKPVEVL